MPGLEPISSLRGYILNCFSLTDFLSTVNALVFAMLDPEKDPRAPPLCQTERHERRTSASEKLGWSARDKDLGIGDLEAAESTCSQDLDEEIAPADTRIGHSLDLKRTASNALSRVASRLTTRSIVNPPPPPDGGVKAWTQVAMGWLVVFTTWGWVNSYGAFQSYYTLNLGLPASTVSWIGSVQNFLTFVIGAFSGRLLDAGLFIPTLVAGAVMQLLGIFFMSLSTQYWQLMITQGIMVSLTSLLNTIRTGSHSSSLSVRRLALEAASFSRLAWA